METIKMSDILGAAGRLSAFARKHFLKGVLIVLICGVFGVVYYFFQKPKYEATVKFFLEEKGSGVSGGLAGLASQFGVDIGGMTGNSGMFSGDNILDILKSQSIVETVLLSKVDSSKGPSSPTLADRYLAFSGLKARWQNKNPALAGLSFETAGPATPHSLLQDSILFVLYETLTKKHVKADRFNKKGSIIIVTTESEDQLFSKMFSERLVDATRTLYINVKTGVSAANVARLEARADSLQKVMNAKSYQSASLQVFDPNSAFRTSAVPAEVSQRDRMVTYAIYTEVVKNLEAGKMAIASQTPVIQVLDSSKYPLVDRRKGLVTIVAIALLIGVFICAVISFFLYPAEKKRMLNSEQSIHY